MECQHANHQFNKHYRYCPNCHKEVVTVITMDMEKEHHISKQPEEPIEELNLKHMLTFALNFYGVDSDTNTPDHILADYLMRALEIYEETLKKLNIIEEYPRSWDDQIQQMKIASKKLIGEKFIQNINSTIRAANEVEDNGKSA